MSCHAEFLRVALSNDETLSHAVLYGDPTALELAPRQRALIEVVRLVTLAPWSLSRQHRARWSALDDDDLVHAIALSSYFGHLNRIADAVAVPLDYACKLAAPPIDHARAPFERAPHVVITSPALELARRPATATAMAAWRDHIRDKPSYAAIAAWNDGWLGAAPASEGSGELYALAARVALAPWQLDDDAYAPLRAQGWSDAALFDACTTASSTNAWTRIDVALRALAQ
jgi:alkylhydroperoxidase family enzyme